MARNKKRHSHEGKQKKVKKTAGNTHSNEGANAKSKTVKKQEQIPDETAEEKIVRKAYELPSEWKISQIGKRKFFNLPSSLQNGAGKEACIKDALAAHKELIPDPTRYWIWLVDETDKLTRVWDFKETCEAAGVDPKTVAQHLILEGKMVCNAIRMEGLKAYGSNIRMFKEPLFEDEFELFSKKAEVKEEGADE